MIFFSSPFDSVSRATRKPVGDVKLFPRIWIPRGSVSSCRVSPAVFQLHANMANCRQSFCAYLHTPPRCYLASASRVPGRSCARSLWKMCAKKRRLLGFHPILTGEIYLKNSRNRFPGREKGRREESFASKYIFERIPNNHIFANRPFENNICDYVFILVEHTESSPFCWQLIQICFRQDQSTLNR